MSWRKTLSLVGSLAGVGASALVGCTSDCGGEGRVVDDNPFFLTPEQQEELCGWWLSKRSSDDWTYAAFGEPLRFRELNEPVDTMAYATITFLDGRVFGGKYAMKATYLKGDSGGPAGFVNSYSIVVDEVHLVERMVKPQAPAGVKALLPGEFVVRKVAEGELPRVNDQYVVELPANRHAFMDFDPRPARYPFQVSIVRDGVSVATAYDEKSRYANGYLFETGAGGRFSISVRGTAPTGEIPDRYQFQVGWGELLDRTCAFRPDWVEFKDPANVGNKNVNQNNQSKGE